MDTSGAPVCIGSTRSTSSGPATTAPRITLLKTSAQASTPKGPAPEQASGTKKESKKKRSHSTGVSPNQSGAIVLGPVMFKPTAAAPAAADTRMKNPEEECSDAEDASDSSSSEDEEEEDEDPEEIVRQYARRQNDPDYGGEDYDSEELVEMFDDDEHSDGDGPDVVWTEKMLERVNARKYRYV